MCWVTEKVSGHFRLIHFRLGSNHRTLDPGELVKTRPSLPSRFPKRKSFMDTKGKVRTRRVAHKSHICCVWTSIEMMQR